MDREQRVVGMFDGVDQPGATALELGADAIGALRDLRRRRPHPDPDLCIWLVESNAVAPDHRHREALAHSSPP